MDFGFKPKPVFRFLRSRLVSAQKTASHGCVGFLTFIRTRTFARTFFICISMSAITFIIANTKIVQVVNGGSARYIYTLRTSKVSILKQCGITLKPEDQSNLSAFTNNFAKLEYYPAFTVAVTADGRTRNIVLARGTVADVLSNSGISLGEYDEINEPVDQTVYSGEQIVVKRVSYQIVTKDTPIGYPVVKSVTTLLKKDLTKVISPGQDGVSETTMKQKLVDGVVTDQTVLSQTVVSQPVACQMLVGTAANTPVSQLNPPSSLSLSASGTPTSYARVIHGLATGYSPVDGKYTASGRAARVGYVAVNPNIIPYGSSLYIMSSDGSFVYGYAKAYDTGGFSCNGSGVTVDLFFSSLQETELFGKRSVDIYVIS